MATKTKKKKKQPTQNVDGRLSHKDLQIVYLTEGAAAFLKLVTDGTTTVAVARRAAQEIQKLRPDATESLPAALDKIAPKGVLGKEGPKIGMIRGYKAQEVAGKLFMRLPLDLLGIKKRDRVDVLFEEDKFTVSKHVERKRAIA